MRLPFLPQAWPSLSSSPTLLTPPSAPPCFPLRLPRLFPALAFSLIPARAHAHTAGAAASPPADTNVLGTPLGLCCSSPMTGWFRDGLCRTDERDFGRHTVCARVTREFLEFSAGRGNDLRGILSEGDKWCLCVSRWKEAMEAGVAPPVVLEATHRKALEVVTLAQLESHALRE